ncbi:MAG: pilus assembly PilX N-terminal domain-containing protein [Deltaproteobacteria bacterium]|nr:pilus assembly PilX N-terminal domain-containing protein [Deltaproteobacteria bacterium]
MGSVYKNENGAALVISLMFLAILAMLGSTAVVLTTTDMKIGANYKTSAQSFADADAGVNYALSTMEAGLKASPQTFTLPSTVGATSTLAYTAPSGFSFTISDVTMTATNAYSFTSTGSGPDNAQTVLQVTFERDSAISFAAFGDSKLDTKNGGTTLSYDSQSSDPTKNDPTDPSFQTTHEADVGSNDWLVTHNGASIDGSGVLGEQADGSATTTSIHGGTTFYGTTPVDAGRVDPDPLGVNGGGEYDPTTYADPNNDNDSIPLVEPDGELSADSIDTNGSVTLFGKAGGSNFYLTSVVLRNGATLTIDTTAGEVNIFLTGPLDARSGSSIVLTPDPYDATKFSIFSNSTSKIDFKNSSTVAGLIYAPYAPVDVKNSAAFYGAIWGDNVDIKNGGTVYFDTALKDKYTSNNLTATAWQDLQS